MSVERLISTPCTVTHRAPADEPDVFGDVGWEETTTSTRCYLEQRASSEDTAGQVVGTGDWVGVFLPDLDLAEADRVDVDGVAYEVNGPPWPVLNPRVGRVSHILANLRRTA